MVNNQTFNQELYEESHNLSANNTKSDELSLVREVEVWRSRLVKLRGSQKLRAILDFVEPQQLIHSMGPQELLYTFKEIGLSDCAELVTLASVEQIQSCLDLDCWKKDAIEVKSIEEWLQFLLANEQEAAEKVLSALDPDVLVIFLRNVIRLYHRDKDEPDPEIETEGELIESPDGNYLVEIPFPADDPRSDLTRGALHLFFQYGHDFCYPLFETILCALSSELEERAYQFRKSRIEDLGFIDYYDAIGIYQALPHRAEPMSPSQLNFKSIPLPVLAMPRTTNFFNQVMAEVTDPSQQERINAELIYLNNKVLSADQIDFGQRTAAERCLREVLHTLEIGLEILVGNNLSEAAQYLCNNHIEWIFRNGFTAIALLRQKANRLARDSRFSLCNDAPLSLIDQPYIDLLHALRQIKPRFSTAFDQPPGFSSRPFHQLQEIILVDEILEMIGMMPTLFFEEFAFSHADLQRQLHEIRPVCGKDLQDIHFSHIFLTALVNFCLYDNFQPLPVSTGDIQRFFAKIFLPQAQTPHILDPDFQQRIECLLLERPNTIYTQIPRLQRFLQQVWHNLCEEAAYLPLDQVPDPRFVNLFISKI
jgi:hypothetical protein